MLDWVMGSGGTRWFMTWRPRSGEASLASLLKASKEVCISSPVWIEDQY